MKLLTRGLLVDVEYRPLTRDDGDDLERQYLAKFNAHPTELHAGRGTRPVILGKIESWFGMKIVENGEVPMGYVWLPFLDEIEND